MIVKDKESFGGVDFSLLTIIFLKGEGQEEKKWSKEEKIYRIIRKKNVGR